MNFRTVKRNKKKHLKKNASLSKASNMQPSPMTFPLFCAESFLFYTVCVCVLLNTEWEKTLGEWIFIVLMLYFRVTSMYRKTSM